MPVTSTQIKDEALRLGFDACGVCRAESVEQHSLYLRQWLDLGKHAGMHFMQNHWDKRVNPSLLMDGAQSLIMLALNYYPAIKRDESLPRVAYFAYGKDYHLVMKNKLRQLLDFITVCGSNDGQNIRGRVFCDSAPILEKYHGYKAGIGWLGKNTQLVIEGKGSFFFLGAILVNVELEYDKPQKDRCGTCRRCIDACPTQALEAPHVLNATRCLAYLTIENKGEIPDEYAASMGNQVYGCDLCLQVCPWNRFATPTPEAAFNPSEEFLGLNADDLHNLPEKEFQRIFKDSAIQRAGYAGLKRNAAVCRKNQSANRSV